jgi:Rps23 Pro-64 3,4-dihydroxylase Tpa1-like proline 4-hydroxylase
MTAIEDLISRVSQLEETVSHLTTHHDEQFLMVHDDITRDTCDRLFNVNLRNVRQEQHHATTKRRDRTSRRKRVVTVKRKRA